MLYCYQVVLWNVALSKKFEIYFHTPYSLTKYLNKTRFSKKVSIISWDDGAKYYNVEEVDVL